jgi:hypothetical protein
MTSPTRRVASLDPTDIWFLIVCCGGQLGLFTVGVFVGWDVQLILICLCLWTTLVGAARRKAVGDDD